LKQLIRQAKIVFSDHIAKHWDMLIENGHICACGFNLPTPDDCLVDSFNDDIIIPGLIDTHVHGAGGADTMDGTAASLTTLRQTLLKEGTTAFLATTMTSSPKQLTAVLDNIYSAANNSSTIAQAQLLGVHMEGPWLSQEYKGAHKSALIPPSIPDNDLAALARLIHSYPGLIRIVTSAIERADAEKLATLCHRHGIIAAVGHSGASYELMLRAAAAGISRVTHAFNALPKIHQRQPGLLTEGLLNSAIELELIADGVHVHPAILELAIRLKPLDKITLISDGTRAVGMPNGEYELGGQTTIVENGIARLADGTIAGSAYPLLQGLRTIVQTLKRPLYEAVRFTSLNPAQALGVADKLGSFEVGKDATFIRLTEDLKVKQVWLQGIRVI